MLALHGHNAEGLELVLMVLEPGNIEKLKQGQPIHKFLNEFLPSLPVKVELVFAYSPDIEWVTRRIGSSREMETIASAISESLSRPEVMIRGKSAEDLKKVF